MTRPTRDRGPDELTDRQRRELLEGDVWADIEGWQYSAFEDEDHKRQAWERHCEELLAEYMSEKPGRRPDGWWRYDSPEGYGRHEPRATVVVLDPEKSTFLSPETFNLFVAGELTDEERNLLPDDLEDNRE